MHGPLTIFSKIHNEGLITDIVLPHYTAQTCVKDKEMISKKKRFWPTKQKHAENAFKMEIKYGNIFRKEKTNVFLLPNL